MFRAEGLKRKRKSIVYSKPGYSEKTINTKNTEEGLSRKTFFTFQ